jgi:hypothetical protein
MIITLNGAHPERLDRNAVPDAFGNGWVYKNLPVLRRAAKPRRQIDDTSDCGVVDPPLLAGGSDNRWHHGDAQFCPVRNPECQPSSSWICLVTSAWGHLHFACRRREAA